MTAPLVLPVGLPLGPLHLPGATGPAPLLLARGAAEEVLAPAEAQAWEAAHQPATCRGGRAVLTTVVGEAGVAQPEATVATLLARGLLVEVTPGTPGAAAFARAHRVRPLQLGLGNTPDRPHEYSFGLVGRPALRVDLDGYTALLRAVLWPDLWTAAHVAALLAAGTEFPAPSEEETARQLDELLLRLPELLGHWCGWLDAAGP